MVVVEVSLLGDGGFVQRDCAGQVFVLRAESEGGVELGFWSLLLLDLLWGPHESV